MLALEDHIGDGCMMNHHKQDEDNLEVIPQIYALFALRYGIHGSYENDNSIALKRKTISTIISIAIQRDAVLKTT